MLIATKELTIKPIIALPVPGSRYAQAVLDKKILKNNTKKKFLFINTYYSSNIYIII
tara:strand:+ start:432 stop:602 length:171 start_codon:yes stop_codon:yes gene_type:complete